MSDIVRENYLISAVCKLAITLALMSAVLPAFAAGRVECSSLKSKYVPSAVGYCALLPPSYGTEAAAGKTFPVLYLLHGLSDKPAESSLPNVLFDPGRQVRLDAHRPLAHRHGSILPE